MENRDLSDIDTSAAPDAAGAHARRDRPNVVFVVLDDVGFADLGCYGSEISTPAMDRLAQRGLRYTNFHTTAMCSPTRASLLTGRQHHAVGMGIIAEWSTEHPGYTGRMSKKAANLAEVLGDDDYDTLAVGKWHLMPQSDANPAGPFDDWPLRRGFNRWFGFHGALADSWNPELFEDNHTLESSVPDGVHLSETLVDRSIDYVRDHHMNAPERPFFLYLAFGAAHWPHHVPQEYIERYRGRYDIGWDEIRRSRLRRQIDLGIVPPETELAPRNEGVAAWDDLDDERRRLFARMQEIYAGFIEHTDDQLGRLLDYLEQTQQLDNTLIVLLSDNGSSPEGGPDGAVNGRKQLVYESESIDEKVDALDVLGSPRAYNHYPWGWAQASNTPLKWYKKDVHGGGVRDPFIVSWPDGIADQGTIRDQFHHVVDVTPTVLELIGVTSPDVYQGVPQMAMHGTSMVGSIRSADAPTTKGTQYFELLGDRALWRDGWKAVSRHQKGVPFDDDVWELYHLDEDYSETRNLADAEPERLRAMIEEWWEEARRYDVLPLDDREYERVADSIAARARRSTTLVPKAARLDRYHVPDITDRSYVIDAKIAPYEGTAEGVLLSVGSRFGGLVLYVQDRHLVFEYSFDSSLRWKLRSETPIPNGAQNLRLQFERTSPRAGVATVVVDDVRMGSLAIERTWPVAGLAGGMHCGRDGSSPVSDSYPYPFAFTGDLSYVRIDLLGDPHRDERTETRTALSED